MVVIDDTQPAVDRNGVVKKQEIALPGPRLHLTRCRDILLGLGRMRFFVEQDPQITWRRDAEVGVEPYRWDADDNDTGRADFIGMLLVFWQRFPLPWSSQLNLERDKMRNFERFLYNCKVFFDASGGVIGLLKKLFLGAIRISRRRRPQRWRDEADV